MVVGADFLLCGHSSLGAEGHAMSAAKLKTAPSGIAHISLCIHHQEGIPYAAGAAPLAPGFWRAT